MIKIANGTTLERELVTVAKGRKLARENKPITYRGKLKKGVFLTFDDGPDKKFTPKILAILKEFRAKATFFVVGKKAKRNPDIIQHIFSEGHAIGNHTYSHPVSPILKTVNMEKEIALTDKIITRITGEKPRLFRPTWSIWDFKSKKMDLAIKRLGHYSMRWSISSIDWLGLKSIIRHQILRKKIINREVLLFHDGVEKCFISKRKPTIEVLPDILTALSKGNNYFLKLSEFIPKIN